MLGWTTLSAEETTMSYSHKSSPSKKIMYFELAKKYIPHIIGLINQKLRAMNAEQGVMLFQIKETYSTPADEPSKSKEEGSKKGDGQGKFYFFDFEIRAYEGASINENQIIGVSHSMRIAVDSKSGKAVCGVTDPVSAAKSPGINKQGRTNVAPRFTISRKTMSNTPKPIMQGTKFQTAAMDVSILATKSALFIYTGMSTSNKVDTISFIRCIDTLGLKVHEGSTGSAYSWLSNGWFDRELEIVKGDKPFKVQLHSGSQQSKDSAILYEMMMVDKKMKNMVRAYIPGLYETDQQRIVHGCDVLYDHINLTTVQRQIDDIYFFICLSIPGLRSKVLAVYPKQEDT